MKLIAASTTLFASLQAQAIGTLLQELVDQIYQVSDDGKTHSFNIAPYFQSDFTCQGNGWKSEGSFGNGNGVIQYSDSATYEGGEVIYEWKAEGTAKSHPAASMFPAEVLDDHFTAELTFNADAEGFNYDYAGTINDIPWSNEMKLNLDEVQITNKKYSAVISFTRDFHIPNQVHDYWKQFSLNGKSNLKMTANARKACMDDLLGKDCTAKITIEGTNDDLDLGQNSAKYSVNTKKAQLTVTHNKQEVFWLGLVGIDSMEVLALKYKINQGKAVLIVQAMGPNGVGAFLEAASMFAEPFGVFFDGFFVGHGYLDFEAVIRALVYVDKVFEHIQGNVLFQCLSNC